VPSGLVSIEMPASSAEVFALLHDYPRRLEWDTLLAEAYVEGGGLPGVGAIAVCRGKRAVGGFPMRTRYISYRPGHVAAVELLGPVFFFERFAASIRHRDLGDGRSIFEYRYRFLARPHWLRWCLHPLMNAALGWETRKRLRALACRLAATIPSSLREETITPDTFPQSP
jgi:hypothetical protein